MKLPAFLADKSSCMTVRDAAVNSRSVRSKSCSLPLQFKWGVFVRGCYQRLLVVTDRFYQLTLSHTTEEGRTRFKKVTIKRR